MTREWYAARAAVDGCSDPLWRHLLVQMSGKYGAPKFLRAARVWQLLRINARRVTYWVHCGGPVSELMIGLAPDRSPLGSCPVV